MYEYLDACLSDEFMNLSVWWWLIESSASWCYIFGCLMLSLWMHGEWPNVCVYIAIYFALRIAHVYLCSKW